MVNKNIKKTKSKKIKKIGRNMRKSKKGGGWFSSIFPKKNEPKKNEPEEKKNNDQGMALEALRFATSHLQKSNKSDSVSILRDEVNTLMRHIQKLEFVLSNNENGGDVEKTNIELEKTIKEYIQKKDLLQEKININANKIRKRWEELRKIKEEADMKKLREE